MDIKRFSESKYTIRYSYEYKKKVCEEYLSGNYTKREIWKKYTGQDHEHGSLLKWLRELGYVGYGQKVTFAPIMKKEREQDTQSASKENISLKQKIHALEKALEEAELKAIAYSTMIDIAEEEFKIPIRKK